MKIAFKIMTGVMLVVAVLLVIHGYLVVKREIAQFKDDMNLHAYLLGEVMATSVEDVWKSVGSQRAKSIIADANRSERLVRVRLVRLDQESSSEAAPLVDLEKLSELQEDKEIIFPNYDVKGTEYHIACFPVSIEARPCALELSQPLSIMHRYTLVTILHKIGLFIAFLLIGGGLVWWLGNRLVGRPVEMLVGQAQGVGQGNLEITNNLEKSRDEIGALSRGMNQMVLDLRLARERLEKETAERLAAVEQLNHAERLSTVGKLASGLAHELGTPLNVVSGRAKMIEEGGMNEEDITDSATVIHQQADRMANLIRKLLDFARRSPNEKSAESLSHSVDQVEHLLAPLAKGRDCTIDVESDGESPMIKADPSQIQQVLSNLIVNAVHAMPDGGQVAVRYGVRQALPPADQSGPEGEFAYIDVVDKGVGISEDDLGRIFVPFFSTKQVGEGTGLGLSIAHGIIKEHGGWINVTSVVGEGSTFSIYLPVERND